MFANTYKDFASAKHSAISGICVDPDRLVFLLWNKLTYTINAWFSQLTWENDDYPAWNIYLIRDNDLFFPASRLDTMKIDSVHPSYLNKILNTAQARANMSKAWYQKTCGNRRVPVGWYFFPVTQDLNLSIFIGSQHLLHTPTPFPKNTLSERSPIKISGIASIPQKYVKV